MRLVDAPVGVFKHNGVLVLKTEYWAVLNGTYVPDCYILASGEKFYGDIKTYVDFGLKYNNLEVEPVEISERTTESCDTCAYKDNWALSYNCFLCKHNCGSHYKQINDNSGCNGCKYFDYWSNRKPMCAKHYEKICIPNGFKLREKS